MDLQGFDNASRGPLGSLQFFFKRPTMSLWTYLGCLVVFTAIATDPFTQQIIKFETDMVPLEGSVAQLKSSQIYDRGNEGNPYSDAVQFRKDDYVLCVVSFAKLKS